MLVVSDNVDEAELLAMMLELRGHTAAMAHGGFGALDAARSFRPELVLLDIGLPGMSGDEVARAFRSDPDLSGAVLVALTVCGSDDDKRKSREAGSDLHLTKPVDARGVDDVLARFA